MIKVNEKYRHEETGIEFSVTFYNNGDGAVATKDVVIVPSKMSHFGDTGGFVFSHSNSDTVIKIGKALTEIGEFIQNL